MSKWQPIETAPKDGSAFLTYMPPHDGLELDEDCYDIAHWDDEWGEFAKARCGFEWVTHWMPLPEPPNE